MPPFARDLFQYLPPYEVAITFGIILFAFSFASSRRIVSLPSTGGRTVMLAWVAIAGSLLVATVATAVSWIAVLAPLVDESGYAGWWRRPTPLLAAVLVVGVAALLLRRGPLPAPGERAIAPRRSWNTFASRRSMQVAAVTAVLLLVTLVWQTAIATTAPEEGPFFGKTPVHSDLPVFMTFQFGYGYVGGVGWPNHYATFIALALGAAVLFFVLRADANRPISARLPAASIRVEREHVARVLTLIMLGGLITTLGMVWMHVGSIGTATVGFDEEWVSAETSMTHFNVSTGYRDIADPIALAGYLLQAAGVALLLRVATDSVRSFLGLRRANSGTRDEGGTPARVAGAGQ